MKAVFKQIFQALLIFCFMEAFCFSESQESSFEAYFRDVPVLYKGRFRPMEAYTRLWLYDLYHREAIKPKDRESLGTTTGSAIDLVWQLQLMGHNSFRQSPLFWMHYAELKQILGLEPAKDRFSYDDLHQAIYWNKQTGSELLRLLVSYHFYKNYLDPSNRSKSLKLELKQLSPGLWVESKNLSLTVLSVPHNPPWNLLESSEWIPRHGLASFEIDRPIVEETQNVMGLLQQFSSLQGSAIPSEQSFVKHYNSLAESGRSPEEIASQLEWQQPLQARLTQASPLLKMLPGKFRAGEWYPLQALHVKVYNPATLLLEPAGNFTLYPDALFAEIRTLYFSLEKAVIGDEHEEANALARELAFKLKQGYALIAGEPYTETAGKTLRYPTALQLKAEAWYMRFPAIDICIVLYCLAGAGFFLASGKRTLNTLSLLVFLAAFMLHSALLAIRCYILGRPPVSNMFETVIYVPWITAAISLLLHFKYKNSALLLAASLISVVLLVLLRISHLNANLENVQAVLDSQYWLLIHVLMVVGSYGLFLLCGVLGHFYLAGLTRHRSETTQMKIIANLMLNAMYLGLLLLIPGTVLGGVWAAESWGRFWDWDPKESWAFISICVYLLWVHSYRFNRIGNTGLAVGAVAGLLAISFTWYGVNYILGTGLHSYGFGSGGAGYYYAYVVLELAFLVWAAFQHRNILSSQPQTPKTFQN